MRGSSEENEGKGFYILKKGRKKYDILDDVAQYAMAMNTLSAISSQ